MFGSAVLRWRVAATIALAVAACTACGREGSTAGPPRSSPRTTAAAAANLPPWATHQPIAPTGTNAVLRERFDHRPPAETEGCRPIGTDLQIWTPNLRDEVGFAVLAGSLDGPQVSTDFTRRGTWSTIYDDDSVAYVADVPAGHLLFLALPTEERSTWCIYAFTIPPDTPFRHMLSSMRYLDSPVRSADET